MTTADDSARSSHDDKHGSEDTPSEPYFFIVGRVQRPHGVRGEIKIRIDTHYPEWVAELDVLYIGTDPYEEKDATEYPIKSVRRHGEELLLKFVGVEDRNAADMLRGKLVMMRVDQSEPLDDDEFYTYEIIGMAVYTDDEEYLGDVKEIMETGANDVFILQGGARGTVLIPDIDDVVHTIDPDTRKIIITPLAGLLPGDDA